MLFKIFLQKLQEILSTISTTICLKRMLHGTIFNATCYRNKKSSKVIQKRHLHPLYKTNSPNQYYKKCLEVNKENLYSENVEFLIANLDKVFANCSSNSSITIATLHITNHWGILQGCNRSVPIKIISTQYRGRQMTG